MSIVEETILDINKKVTSSENEGNWASIFVETDNTFISNANLAIENEGEKFLKSMLQERENYIINESWGKEIHIHGRILEIGTEEIVCECVINAEEGIFEERIFERELFTNLKNLATNKLVIVKIRKRPGAARIDILSGEGIVNPKIFTIQNQLDEVDNLYFEERPFNYD